MNKELTINSDRLKNRLNELATIGKIGKTGVRRLALSKEYKEALLCVKKWMDEAGLKTRIDHFGNLIGRMEGKNPHAPVVMLGSHVDSQPNGGRFDGPIGVLGGLEVIETMNDLKIKPEVPIEIIAFCDEEGYRFNIGLFGSRGVTGKWTNEELDRTDEHGISRREALIEFGANPEKLKSSEYKKGSIGKYIEMHIEQGPILETADAPIGIVTGIAGPLWLTIELTGFAGHAGTVPMHLRKDALVGAAKIITSLNEIVQAENTPTVGTVGNLQIKPGARAVIPEKVKLTIDLRDIDIQRRSKYESKLRKAVEEICQKHQLTYTISEDINITPEHCNEDIIEIMQSEAKAIGLENVPELMSGAFHDALAMAAITDVGMIFVQSKDGISHNPKEFSKHEHIAIGTELLFLTTLKLAMKTK